MSDMIGKRFGRLVVIGDGDVHGPASSVDNEIVLFDGTTGKTIKSGVVVGDVVGSDLQPTPTDTTAGGVLTVGSFGLGTTGALSMPIGTTLERPVVTVDGQTRINTTTGVLEYYYGSTWNNVPKLAVGYINGLGLTHVVGSGVTIAIGSCVSYDGTTACILSAALTKNLTSNWVAGGTGGVAVGGRASGAPLVANQFYRVFLISKPDGTSDVGFDTSTTAANLLADAGSAGYTKYRRIGWVQEGPLTGRILQFQSRGNIYSRASGVALATQAVPVSAYTATSLPANVIGQFGVMLESSSAGKKYAVFNRLANASISNFDIVVDGTSSASSAQIETFIASGASNLSVNATASSLITINQMGWIDDTSNLLNV